MNNEYSKSSATHVDYDLSVLINLVDPAYFMSIFPWLQNKLGNDVLYTYIDPRGGTNIIDRVLLMGTKVRRHFTRKIEDQDIKTTSVQKQNLT